MHRSARLAQTRQGAQALWRSSSWHSRPPRAAWPPFPVLPLPRPAHGPFTPTSPQAHPALPLPIPRAGEPSMPHWPVTL